jgi:mannose-6-phosphate isomerase
MAVCRMHRHKTVYLRMHDMDSVMVLSGSRRNMLWGSEDWLVSVRKGESSIVESGWRAGESLDCIYPDFPLLFKVINAKSRLSVQVHPNERSVQVTGGEPKTEMWCALSDGPIYAGFKPGTTVDDLEKAVYSGEFENLLVRHDAKAGDVFFIPGGLAHAIGDEVELFEVQQSSDTTFRFYDWGRVDENGVPRELHLQQALQAVDVSLPPPVACRSLATPFFDFSQMKVEGSAVLDSDNRFLVGFAVDGDIAVNGIHVRKHGCFLLPPGNTCTIKGAGVSLCITTTPPKCSSGESGALKSSFAPEASVV